VRFDIEGGVLTVEQQLKQPADVASPFGRKTKRKPTDESTNSYQKKMKLTNPVADWTGLDWTGLDWTGLDWTDWKTI
jgi:hypothetical protein